MNGLEIRKRIDANNRKIQKALNKFTLTDEINQLMQENADLRAHCPHEFASMKFVTIRRPWLHWV